MDKILQETLAEILKTKANRQPKRLAGILKANPALKAELEREFALDPAKYGTVGKCALVMGGCLQLGHCIACGKELSYDRTFKGSKFCSDKCKLSKGFNPSSRPEIKEKIKQHNLEKYGVENPAQSQEVQQRIKETNMKRYGVENAFQSEEIKGRIRRTLMEKYGVDHPRKNKEILEKSILARRRTTYAELVKKAAARQLEPLFGEEEYQKAGVRYMWKCSVCGNEFEAAYDNGYIIGRCFKCHPLIRGTSYMEKELCEFVESLGFEVKNNDRRRIAPHVLDIEIPPRTLAIEFHGDFWHSEKMKADMNYHAMKADCCEKAGWQLLQVFEYEWEDPDSQKIIKEKIKATLGAGMEKVSARECSVKEISVKEKNEFLQIAHIQGADLSDIKLGLFLEDKLVAVMTFAKPRFTKDCQWELVRYASAPGLSVRGGAGKLLAAFEQKYNPESIVTYADRRFSVGNMYRRIGFSLKSVSAPNYVWWKDGGHLVTRYQAQKHKLADLLGEAFDPAKSEKENMEAAGYCRIYDAGNLVFVKKYEK